MRRSRNSWGSVTKLTRLGLFPTPHLAVNDTNFVKRGCGRDVKLGHVFVLRNQHRTSEFVSGQIVGVSIT